MVSVGDRFETMATAIAAAYMNIPVAHTMGGEISGTIDESIRHAVTKLVAPALPGQRAGGRAHHPDGRAARHRARRRLPAHRSRQRDREQRGRHRRTPSGSTARASGAHIDVDQPFLLVNQHPVTTEYGQGKEQIWETLLALDELRMPTIMLWPNVDAGSEDIATGMRTFREKHRPDYIRFYKNFPIETYVRLMLLCACAVGNSSAPIREGAFLGVPAVNIGTRQAGRDRGPNVVDVAARPRGDRRRRSARQLAHGRYPSDRALRRRRSAGPRIADVLADGAAVGAEAAVVHGYLMRVLGVIPARGGSKGIARQEPARRWAAGRCWPTRRTPARGSRRADADRASSTDDAAIAEAARGRSASTCRSCGRAALAADDTPMLPVLQHAVAAMRDDGFDADVVVLLQPTSPLRRGRAHRRGGRAAGATRRRFGGVRRRGAAPVQPGVGDAARRRAAAAVPRRPAGRRGGRTSRACYARNGPAVLAVRAAVLERGSLYGDDCRPLVMTAARFRSTSTRPGDLELVETSLLGVRSPTPDP